LQCAFGTNISITSSSVFLVIRDFKVQYLVMLVFYHIGLDLVFRQFFNVYQMKCSMEDGVVVQLLLCNESLACGTGQACGNSTSLALRGVVITCGLGLACGNSTPVVCRYIIISATIYMIEKRINVENRAIWSCLRGVLITIPADGLFLSLGHSDLKYANCRVICFDNGLVHLF
jgi:hypothetical protein